MLYNKGFLCPTLNESTCDLAICNNAQCLSRSMTDAMDANKKGLDGKCRILSIVADNFTAEELNKLRVNCLKNDHRKNINMTLLFR